MADREHDLVVVGGGIVGLGVARRFLQGHAGASVVVLEKESSLAAHQTGHNSGVVHSGIYYKPGSLKARLCLQGAGLMHDFCADHGLPWEQTGKLIVAVRAGEQARLDDLEARAVANGLTGVRRLRAEEIVEIEPYATGIDALHVPSTASTDYTAVCGALRNDIEQSGGTVSTGVRVESVAVQHDNARVRTADGPQYRARRAIVCGGLQADRLSRSAGGTDDVHIVPFRGSYFDLSQAAAARVRSMIYPVPDPRFPFLGVHFTRHVDGTVSCGPNAVLALAREKYERHAFDRADTAETLRFAGTWRLGRKYWRKGLEEVVHDLSSRLYLRSARRYLPSLESDDLTAGKVGIRAQAVDRSGALLDDFAFVRQGPVVHVINAPSPAATSSLAIAEELVARLEA